MEPRGKRGENANPQARVPYERPELKQAGMLRDVTAQTPSTDFG
jgi:hypothetical protein